MADPRFVHLRLHSEYSIVDGLLRLDDAIELAARDAMPALALTDLGNLFGLVKFYRAARARGVKPIVGVDTWVTPDGDRAQPARLLLLVQDQQGYRRLCELISAAYLSGTGRERAEIPRAALLGGDTRGLIALAGGPCGEPGQALMAGNPRLAARLAQQWAEAFPGRYYLEIQRPRPPHVDADQEALVAATMALADDLELPVVATHPVQFGAREDYKAHEARVCIASGGLLGDPRRPRLFHEDQCFLSQAEMAERFADHPETLVNSVEIAKRCNLVLTLGKSQLPRFPTPDGISLDSYLMAQARAGLERRLSSLFADDAARASARDAYTARLETELATICQMGFSGYFLIVADFIRWAKGQGIPVGPGRGSGAGSLVAYALDITDIDPLRYDLLFERFLNPERVSMPDFDIDFCQDGRDRVIGYVRDKYGQAAVSQIATFGTMAAKAVIRDVGRVLDLPFNFVDQFAKLIPAELGITLAQAREKEPLIGERIEREEELRELWDLATRLEGITRNVGMHAGGVLIAPGRITDFCPIYSADGGTTVVSQLDKDDVELVGLVKFDFLGLRTLTIIAEATAFVRRLAPDQPADIDRLPLDDRAVYALFASGNTSAVFQSESRSAKDLERRLKADCFEDLIALMALNRPGPLQSGMVDDFIDRKQGRARPEYFHPDLEAVLKPTYGVIVYQEQVMLIAQVLAGYTLGGADLLRRAMGKKKPEEMAIQRDIFLRGAAERGVAPGLATQLFDLMEKFAEYGFNKSHSAAYALVAYQTAWLKAHYPAAFLAATLSSEMADTDKIQALIQDARANGVDFLPPDINQGAIRFEPVDARTIRYGLGAIKGTGEAALAAVLRARADGPFADLFDFCRRLDRRQVNRRSIEAMIRAGAFDALDGDRARLLARVGIALEAAEQAEANALQGGLFDAPSAAPEPACLPEVPPWSERERLLQEKQALGFFFSGHPYDAYRSELAAFVRRPLRRLEPGRESVLIAGVVTSLRTQMTRRGKMIVVVLQDGDAQVEVTVFPELYESQRHKIREDDILLVQGRPQADDFTGGIRVAAEGLLTLAEARTRHARALYLALDGPGETDPGATVHRLRELLEPFRDQGCPVWVRYRNRLAQADIPLGETWRVRLDDALLDGLADWLQRDNVEVTYA